jgi:hypothetical protein
MEEEIKKILVDLAIKFRENQSFIDNIKNSDDIDFLANIAIVFLDKSLNGKYFSYFMRLRTFFSSYYGYNMASSKSQIATYKRELSKFSGIYLDGNFRNEHFVPLRLKVLIPETELNDIAYKFYTSSSEIIHDYDRLDEMLRIYFFSDYGDVVVYDDVSKVSMALITYVRRKNNSNLVIKRYKVNNEQLDYEEVEIPKELEKLYYSAENSKNRSMIETYEKMYVDACTVGGVYSFLEIMSVIDKLNIKKINMIRETLNRNSGKNMEVVEDGLQKVSRNALSKC